MEAVLLLVDFVELFAGVLSADLAEDLEEADLLLAVVLAFCVGFVVEGLAALRAVDDFSVFEDFDVLAVLGAGLSSDFVVVFFAAAGLAELVFSASAVAGFVAAGLEAAGLFLAAAAVVAAAGEAVVRPFALTGSEVATNAATEATTRAVVSSRTRFMAVISLRETV